MTTEVLSRHMFFTILTEVLLQDGQQAGPSWAHHWKGLLTFITSSMALILNRFQSLRCHDLVDDAIREVYFAIC